MKNGNASRSLTSSKFNIILLISDLPQFSSSRIMLSVIQCPTEILILSCDKATYSIPIFIPINFIYFVNVEYTPKKSSEK